MLCLLFFFKSNPSVQFVLPIYSWVWGLPLEHDWANMGATVLKKTLSFPRRHQMSIVPHLGVGCVRLSPFHVAVGFQLRVHWLTLCRSSAGNRSCCVFKDTAVLSCPEDIGQVLPDLSFLKFFLFPPPWQPLSLEEGSVMQLSHLWLSSHRP